MNVNFMRFYYFKFTKKINRVSKRYNFKISKSFTFKNKFSTPTF